MQVFVKVKPDNKIVIIEAEASDDVTVISDRVFAQLNINPETDLVKNPENGSNGYKVVFRGKTLEAGRTLSDYNIQKEADGDIYLILTRKSALDKLLTGIANFSLWSSNNSQSQQQIPAAASPAPAIVCAQVPAPAAAQAPAAVTPVNYNLSSQVDSDSDTPDTGNSKTLNKR